MALANWLWIVIVIFTNLLTGLFWIVVVGGYIAAQKGMFRKGYKMLDFTNFHNEGYAERDLIPFESTGNVLEPKGGGQSAYQVAVGTLGFKKKRDVTQHPEEIVKAGPVYVRNVHEFFEVFDREKDTIRTELMQIRRTLERSQADNVRTKKEMAREVEKAIAQVGKLTEQSRSFGGSSKPGVKK